MTKGKKFASRMMFALLILTLVSFCLVGFTFARYTSTGEGSATMNVAKWDVTNSFGAGEVTFDQLSPSMDSYEVGKTRKHETDKKDFVTITNNSDVAAKVEIDITAIQQSLEATLLSGNSKINQTAPGTLDLNNNSVNYDTLSEVFKIEVYKDAETEALTDDATTGKYTVTLATGDATTLKAKVIWTSDLVGDAEGEADKRDTVIGKTIKSLTFTISYTAVQASEIPANSETPAA